jgi:CrcB protein
MNISRFLLVALGGAAGTGARYLVSIWAVHVFGPASLVGTLAVNVCGSFLLSVVFELSLTTAWIGPTARLVLATGLLGGFTTYSTFNHETLAMLRSGSWAGAFAYALLTFAGCLLAGAAGLAAGRAITS